MSAGPRKVQQPTEGPVISILLVDDNVDVRDNIQKLIAFEADMEVVGVAGDGRSGVQAAKDLQPDVIIMDINMPDMDGLKATEIINKQVPTAAVIIMSVQDEPDYMRKALRAGARDFLGKPVNMDDLYNTIRTVYRNHETVRRQYQAIEGGALEALRRVTSADDPSGDRAGHVIVVYSPQGGTGKTTIATSLASGLMKEDVRVLLIDADLQFADIAMFLNLKAQMNITHVAQDVDDLDIELFQNNVVVTHDSGLKVLLGPARPEEGENVTANPETIGKIIQQVRSLYDFVVVDTPVRLDEPLLNVFDQATRILIVGTPTLISVKNMRLVLDVFDKMEYDNNKTNIVLNKMLEDRRGKTPTIPVEKVESYLRSRVVGKIPQVDERVFLSAINRGVPAIAVDRNQDRPPMKQFHELANALYSELMAGEEEAEGESAQNKQRSGLAGLFGR